MSESKTQKSPTPDKEKAGIHLTPTQQRLLAHIATQTALEGGITCSKRDFAKTLNCDIRTIDRAISVLRKDNLIETEARYLENGGQVANYYRAVNIAK